MIESPYSVPQGSLDISLRNAFRAHMEWPVDRASLAASVDLGLSNRQIAEYFRVGPNYVHLPQDNYNS